MRFTLIAVGAGFALAFLLGGRFRFLQDREMRLWALLPLGLALQFAAVSSAGGTWPFLLVLLGFACLFAFAVANLAVTGFWMIALGLFLNAFVIGLNHGMPIGKKALAHTGNYASVYPALHHVQRSSDKLLILGDVVPISPIGEIITFGDLILAVGIADVLVHLMRPPKRRRDEEDDDEENRLLPLLDDVVHA
ncbi:MAG: DUF5317 family protein [Acidimicrobiia bacterium]|nr:DUF5317 family protein [Acidimicrobiia bacterium]